MSTPTIIIDKLSYILNTENLTATLSECLDKEAKYIAIPETITEFFVEKSYMVLHPKFWEKEAHLQKPVSALSEKAT